MQRGSTLGTLTVTGKGVPETEIQLLAGADVPQLGFVNRAMAVLSKRLGG